MIETRIGRGVARRLPEVRIDPDGGVGPHAAAPVESVAASTCRCCSSTATRTTTSAGITREALAAAARRTAPRSGSCPASATPSSPRCAPTCRHCSARLGEALTAMAEGKRADECAGGGGRDRGSRAVSDPGSGCRSPSATGPRPAPPPGARRSRCRPARWPTSPRSRRPARRATGPGPGYCSFLRRRIAAAGPGGRPRTGLRARGAAALRGWLSAARAAGCATITSGRSTPVRPLLAMGEPRRCPPLGLRAPVPPQDPQGPPGRPTRYDARSPLIALAALVGSPPWPPARPPVARPSRPPCWASS